MDEQKQKLIERIRQAQNVLVTVSTDPTVDQLSAAIGLTLALNKLNKHGTAVFSGQVPSTIEFLKPEETLEKNTDSLRDFIIALDKSKADKLRYKVEDQVVRIFITPYKSSLSEADLNFSQGDFNVDVVVALGVTEQQELDTAITAHGRILHDATVASVSTTGQGSLGTINWVDPNASSLSEMMVSLLDGLDQKIMDGQIATALLTGIVAGTERFSNEKTTPKTMRASAVLMSAGANQQLVATELDATATPMSDTTSDEELEQPTSPSPDVDAIDDVPQRPPKRDPGTLEIDHSAETDLPVEDVTPTNKPVLPPSNASSMKQLRPEPDMTLPEISKVHGVGAHGQPTDVGIPKVSRSRIVEPPKLSNSDLTANIKPEDIDPPAENLMLPPVQSSSPLLSHDETVLQQPIQPPIVPKPPEPFIPQQPQERPVPPSWQQPLAPPMPPAMQGPQWQPDPAAATPPVLQPAPVTPDETLSEIEKAVDSPHIRIDDNGNLSNASAEPAPPASVDNARGAVEAALNSPAAYNSRPPEPVAALHAAQLGPDLHQPLPSPPGQAPSAATLPPVSNTGFSESPPGSTPADNTFDMPLPSNPFGPGQAVPPNQPAPPSTFPGAPPQAGGPSGTPPPPVPPPMFPLQ